MVSNVSMGNGVNYNNVEFAKNAIKYIQGQQIEKESTGKEIAKSLPTSAAFASVFTVAPAVKSLVKNRKVANGIAENLNIAAGTVKASDVELLEKISKAAIEKTEKKASKGLGKLLSRFSNKTVEEKAIKAGENAVKKATSKAAALTEKQTVKTLAKGVAGEAKGFFVFNMLFQLGEVIPAFKQGGVKEGVKQLGKSVLNAGGDAIGYAAGMKLGALAGSKIGAIAGSVGGPIGVIAGGALGMVLGGVASTLIGKGISKIFGKNYNEKQAEIQEQAQAEEIAKNPEAMNELKTIVEAKVAQDIQSGNKKAAKNANIMAQELNSLPEINSTVTNNVPFSSLTASRAINNSVRLNEANNSTNPFAQTEAQNQNQTQTTVWSPKTVGEITSGLYDQNGNIKNLQFVA